MAKRVEKLPKGIIRMPSKSLRVQVRCRGHKTEVRTFPLLHDKPHERKLQRDEAEAWAVETRRRMRGGELASTRDAKRKTVADALRKLEATLDPNNPNHRKEINRIRQILADPIAARSIAGLRKTDIANYRDELLERGWLKSLEASRGRALDRSGPLSNTRYR